MAVVKMKLVLLVAPVEAEEAEPMALLVKTLAMAQQVKVILVQVAFRSVEVAEAVEGLFSPLTWVRWGVRGVAGVARWVRG